MLALDKLRQGSECQAGDRLRILSNSLEPPHSPVTDDGAIKSWRFTKETLAYKDETASALRTAKKRWCEATLAQGRTDYAGKRPDRNCYLHTIDLTDPLYPARS